MIDFVVLMKKKKLWNEETAILLTIKFCSPRYFGIYMHEGNAVRVCYFQLKITTDATSTRELYSCSFLRGKDESIWLYPFTFIVDLKLHLLLL